DERAHQVLDAPYLDNGSTQRNDASRALDDFLEARFRPARPEDLLKIFYVRASCPTVCKNGHKGIGFEPLICNAKNAKGRGHDSSFPEACHYCLVARQVRTPGSAHMQRINTTWVTAHH